MAPVGGTGREATVRGLARSPLLQGVVVLGGAASVGLFIPWALSSNAGIQAVVPLVACLVLLAFAQWRLGVLALLIYITVEGVVIDVFYPSATPILFKDAIVIALYIGFWVSLLRQPVSMHFPRRVLIPFLALGAVCVVDSFNPGTSLAIGLLGMRVLLICIPLFFVGLRMGREGAFPRVATMVLICSIPVTAFGILEYFLGPHWVSSLGAGFARGYFVVGPEATADFIFRPASTFVFTGFFGAFLFTIATLALGMLNSRAGLFHRLIISAILGLTLVAVVLQSQRTTWVLLPIVTIAMYALNPSLRGAMRAMPVGIAAVVVAGSIGAAVLADRLPVLLSGLGIYQSRLSATTVSPLQQIVGSPVAAIVGHGTGTALGAARYINGGLVPGFFESGWNIVFYMLGVPGVVALVWLYSGVMRLMWRAIQSLPRDERWLSLSALIYFGVTALTSGSVNYSPQNFYFWLFAGLVAGHNGARAAPGDADREVGTASALKPSR